MLEYLVDLVYVPVLLSQRAQEERLSVAGQLGVVQLAQRELDDHVLTAVSLGSLLAAARRASA